MSHLLEAISWNGVSVELCLFTVWPAHVEPREPDLPPGLEVPELLRAYTLQDETGALPGRLVREFDLVFDLVPANLEEVIRGWLTSVVEQGAIVAWFGFEGSFDFEHLLTPDLADQVFGVADANLVATTIDDYARSTAHWVNTLSDVRGRSLSTSQAAVALPSPMNPANAPAWDNYMVAQAVQASLGLIPPNTLAFGVEVDDSHVRTRFQLSQLSDQDASDIEGIVDNLSSLVGEAVHVESAHEIRKERNISPRDGVRWIFLARQPDLTPRQPGQTPGD